MLDLIWGGVAIHGQFRAQAIDLGHWELGALQFQLEHAVIRFRLTVQMVFVAQLHWQRFIGRHVRFQLQEFLLPLALLKFHNADLYKEK